MLFWLKCGKLFHTVAPRHTSAKCSAFAVLQLLSDKTTQFTAEIRQLKLYLFNKNGVLGFGTSVAYIKGLIQKGEVSLAAQDIPGHRPAKMAPKEG